MKRTFFTLLLLVSFFVVGCPAGNSTTKFDDSKLPKNTPVTSGCIPVKKNTTNIGGVNVTIMGCK